MLTVSEAATRLGLTPRGVRYLIKAGRLRAEKRGKSYLINPESVKEYVSNDQYHLLADRIGSLEKEVALLRYLSGFGKEPLRIDTLRKAEILKGEVIKVKDKELLELAAIFSAGTLRDLSTLDSLSVVDVLIGRLDASQEPGAATASWKLTNLLEALGHKRPTLLERLKLRLTSTGPQRSGSQA